ATRRDNPHNVTKSISIHALTQSATPIQLNKSGSLEKISIHALTQSATLEQAIRDIVAKISIHALTQSATFSNSEMAPRKL
ncbi:hypothetical protein CHH91_18485, partial [Virgibacillus sp. 7505]